MYMYIHTTHSLYVRVCEYLYLCRSEGIPADDTVLQGIMGRVASTPEGGCWAPSLCTSCIVCSLSVYCWRDISDSSAGLAESISFNVSSVVPPSPIPPSANADCYTSRRSARLQAQKAPREKPADIMMLSPDKE